MEGQRRAAAPTGHPVLQQKQQQQKTATHGSRFAWLGRRSSEAIERSNYTDRFHGRQPPSEVGLDGVMPCRLQTGGTWTRQG